MCDIINKALEIEPDGKVRFCCLSDSEIGNINNQTWKELWTGKQAELQRSRVRYGEDKGCIHCAFYGPSRFGKEDLTEIPVVRELDFRVSNLCNCKCNICSGAYSSKLNGGKIISLSNQGKQNILDMIRDNTATLEHVHFAGGEPMIEPFVLEVLKLLVSEGISKNVWISYNTNLTLINQDHVDLWKQFKSVLLDLSVDAIGELNDSIRPGSKWSIVEKNIDEYRRLFALPEYNISNILIHPALSTQNVEEIYKIDKYFFLKKIKVHWGNVVDWPERYSIKNMDWEELEEVLKRQKRLSVSPECKSFLDSLLLNLKK